MAIGYKEAWYKAVEDLTTANEKLKRLETLLNKRKDLILKYEFILAGMKADNESKAVHSEAPVYTDYDFDFTWKEFEKELKEVSHETD